VQHREREVLSDEPGRLGRRHLHQDRLASAQPGRGLRGAPVHADVPRVEELLDPCAGEVGGEADDRGVDPDACEVGRGDEGAAVDGALPPGERYQMRDFTCPLGFRITSTMARS
jgi:hypothetical protein